MKTDFDKWKDEDESDAEEEGRGGGGLMEGLQGGGMDLSSMMANMGNFNPGGGAGMDGEEEEDDSDDEGNPLLNVI